MAEPGENKADTSVPGVSHNQLLARRVAIKGWVTRCERKLSDILDKSDKHINTTELNDAMEQFDKMLAKLDDIQCEVECGFMDEEAMLADVNAAADYRDNMRVKRILATDKYKQLCTPQIPVQSHCSSTQSVTPEVKLPKINIPSFSGDVLQWESFWDIFSATVDDSDISEVTKFSYLKSSLTGEAAQAINGIALTASNYNIACCILKERYGRKERLIFSHISQLLGLAIPNKCALASLKTLNDTLQGHTRALENLGIDSAQYGVILTPLVLSRLPQEIRLEWSREAEGRESDLTFLLEFLKKEIVRRERSQAVKESLQQSSVPPAEEKRGKQPTGSALTQQSRQKSAPGTCGICGKGHTTDRCFKLTRATTEERRASVQAAGLCFRCLLPGHISKGCNAVCNKCNGRHHTLFCDPSRSTKMQTKPPSSGTNEDTGTQDKPPPSHSNTPSGSAPATLAHNQLNPPGCNLSSRSDNSAGKSRILLQTACVTVRGGQGDAKVTVLFDTGSDRSYVCSDLVQRVGLEWSGSEPLSYAAFGTGKPSANQIHNMYNCILQDRHGSNHSLLVTEIPVICAPLYRPEVPSDFLESLGGVEFADDYSESKDAKIDILIGLDAYWRFIEPSSVDIVAPGFVAQATVFGYILSGCVPGTEVAGSLVSHGLVCALVSEATVRSFWELESIGIAAEEESVDPVLASFQEDLQMVDGRYQTALIWKPGMKQNLLNNEKLARVRLAQTSKRLSHDPTVNDMFDKALDEMLSLNIIEEIPAVEEKVPGPVYYMPCRPHIRESAVSTKCRPVFDASCKGFNGVSLNDCVEVGPCLLGNLVEILLRFRKWKFAITADIQKAFLQISVRPEDRDVHRFLWNKDGEVKVMRFTRVPFGNCQSPFLLNATIKSHLKCYPDSEAADRLQDDIYMDDFLSGEDSVSECVELVKAASNIMSDASMTFAKWSSNSPDIGEVLLREFRDKCLESDTVKVLGMVWLAGPDHFTFKGPSILPGLCVTKRVIISVYSQLFDPLGFAAPFVITAKCLFQELWALELGWDEEVPSDFRVRFLRWVDDLDVLRGWRVPRCYTPVGWKDISELTLHGFGDASPHGYGACVYLVAKMSDGNCVSSLVIAKAKVAPLKSKTLPRLELIACLLCARLVKFVIRALRLSGDVSYTCWTDSMIALAWIQSNPGRWKTFVANRVIEIQQLTPTSCWSHIPGSENPADLLTRGVSAEELTASKVWLHGPSIMLENIASETVGKVDFAPVDEIEEIEQEGLSSVLVASSDVSTRLFEVERWGSLSKAIRIVAWVSRFVSNLRVAYAQRQLSSLSLNEMQAAKYLLIKDVQGFEYQEEIQALKQGAALPKKSTLYKLSPFIAADGLLRVQGRLQFSASTYEEKHPIILSRGHLSVLFTRFHHVLMKHVAVNAMLTSLRNEF